MRLIFPFILILLAFVSCKNETSTSEIDDSTLPGMFMKYHELALPFSVADSNLHSITDTTTIRYAAFIKLVPDSILQQQFGNERKLTIKPVGIVKNDNGEVFTVTLVKGKTVSSLYVMVFVRDSFATALPILIDKNDRISKTASIDNKFGIETLKTWNAKGGPYYDRQVLAYNGNGSFTIVLTETNENRIINAEIFNPLDSMPATFTYSGNYRKDKNSFVSIRDGSKPGMYKFFVHFETKGEEPCGGEMRGEFKMIKEKEGVYIENGTTCKMDFLFVGNNVTVREQGSCGNHRGIKCFFNDTYTKVKVKKPLKKK